MKPYLAARSVLAVGCIVCASTASGQHTWGGGVHKVQGSTVRLDLRETPEAVVVTLGADVLFDFDRADLKPEAEPTLEKVAAIASSYPTGGVLVEGFTDGIGSDSYNLGLSERRAAAVKEWLVGRGGLGAARVATRGLGMAHPVAPNRNEDGSDNPEGRARNRRVEITVHKR